MPIFSLNFTPRAWAFPLSLSFSRYHLSIRLLCFVFRCSANCEQEVRINGKLPPKPKERRNYGYYEAYGD